MNDTDVRALFSEALNEDPPTPPPALADDLRRGRRMRTRRRLRTVAAGAIASAAAVALAATVVQPQLAQSRDPLELHLASSSEAARSDGGPPRLLIDDPAWSISDAGESDPDSGTLSYVLGDDPRVNSPAGTNPTQAQIVWKRADTTLDQALEDGWGDDEDQAKYTVMSATVAGHDGAVIAHEGQTHQAMWHDNGYRISIWTTLSSLNEFENLVGSVREVDLNTWLAAMPEDFSLAHDNSDAVAAMVEDVPLSEWFENELPSYNERLNHIDPTDTDALRQEVTYLVACYWVKQWIHSELDGTPISISDELSTVVEWARAGDAMTDDVVWDYVESITHGDADGQEMFDTAPEDLRCGGW